MLCRLASVVVDGVYGLVRGAKLTSPGGLAEEFLEPGHTLVGERGYDTSAYMEGLRAMGARAHPWAKSKGSRLDGRTTSRDSYRKRMARRFRVEQAFAWLKAPGRMQQILLRGPRMSTADCMFIAWRST